MIKLLSTLAALALAALLLAGPASADYEQAKEGSEYVHFGVGGEAEQLEHALAVAVNERGEGGVEAGSLYVVGRNARVLRFSPGEEGEAPTFQEAWGWGVGNRAEEYERCGPAYIGRADPLLEHTYETCTPSDPNAPFAPDEVLFHYGHFSTPGGIAVDQATGDVYVRNEPGGGREHNLVEVFTATGTGVAHFGEAARTSPAPPESITEGPAKLHNVSVAEELSIAVTESGTVYLNDVDNQGVSPPRQERVMSFVPEAAGDYEHYVYAEGNDIARRPVGAALTARLALIGNDRLVAATSEAISEYAIGPAGGEDGLLCSVPVSGTLQAMTANVETGEVFYFAHNDKKIHRLGPCDTATGKFEEIQAAVRPAPEVKHLFALAVDASRAWGAGRPAGILYAADPETHTSPATHLGIGDILVPAPAGPPVVGTESIAHTTAGSSVLRAQVDPQGVSSFYHFEYLRESEYLANGESFEGSHVPTTAPASPVKVGAATLATAAVSGLDSDTEYRFRVVLTRCGGTHEPACEAAGEAAALRTFPAGDAGPADGRAYELVSPAEKFGGEVFPADSSTGSCERGCKPPGNITFAVFPMQSAPGGDAVAYAGYPFSPSEGAAVFNSYLSRRTPQGWNTAALSPALLATNGGENLVFDPTLSEDVIAQASPLLPSEPPAPAGDANLYLQSTADPSALTPLVASAPPNRPSGGLILEYAGFSPGTSCQFFAANDALVGEVPGVGPLPDPGPVGRDLYEWCDGRLALVNVLPGGAAVAEGPSFASASPDAHGVSVDGRRVFWEAAGHLYLREDGAVTREVAQPGKFLTASSDGLHVLLSDGCLYSLLTEACTDLTEDLGHVHRGGFLGIAGQSEDLSHIYFVDSEVLTGSEQSCREPALTGGEICEAAQAGKDNLYFWQEGFVHYVATLAASDGAGGSERLADWSAGSSERTAEASPGGRYLAFGSTRQLTGHHNVSCHEENGGEVLEIPCTEVFLYDSATGHLTCPSCNPTGEAPLGNSTLRRIKHEKAWQPQPRYLTDSGRLFFDSQDRLSPRDTNGDVEDVYEAEPQGVGSCARAVGCVLLISPGAGSVDSNFLAMNAGGSEGGELRQAGSDVFFTSRERLAPSDTDELIDLYDAREGGGFPRETETQRAECQGESCQPVTQAPNDATPASSAFHGSGNVKEAKRHHRKHRKRHHKKHGRAAKRNHGGAK